MQWLYCNPRNLCKMKQQFMIKRVHELLKFCDRNCDPIIALYETIANQNHS